MRRPRSRAPWLQRDMIYYHVLASGGPGPPWPKRGRGISTPHKSARARCMTACPLPTGDTRMPAHDWGNNTARNGAIRRRAAQVRVLCGVRVRCVGGGVQDLVPPPQPCSEAARYVLLCSVQTHTSMRTRPTAHPAPSTKSLKFPFAFHPAQPEPTNALLRPLLPDR
jgi:hypothetical protein